MDRMNPLDATFLYVEDGTTHMHIASCAVFEGPAPSYERFAAVYAAKLSYLPRYRQVVRFVPLQLGRPVWVDDPGFRLEDHVRRTALPQPGGDAELRELMSSMMSEELDRDQPLWEAWLVEGLAGGRWALISKIHHCMADGIAGTDLLSTLLDHERDAQLPEPEPWHPAHPPSDLRLVVDAVTDLARSPYEQARAVRRLARAPRRSLANVRAIGAGALSYLGRFLPAPATSLAGGIGPRRRWTWTTVDLGDAKTVRRAFGGTINDVVVTVVTGGLRTRLLANGEPVDQLTLRSLIPVSVRDDDALGIVDNRVSAMFAELPVAIADPVERLAAVREQMEQLKSSHQVDAGIALTTLGQFAPPSAIALAERAVMQVVRRVPRHGINTVVTNVPGPQTPLYLDGREMLEYRPFVPIAPGARMGIAIVSYNGTLTFGITGDAGTAPEVDVVARGIDEAMTELVARARRTASAARPRKSRKPRQPRRTPAVRENR